MLTALAYLLVFQTLGEALAYGLALPVPGPVIGMALMLGWLALRGDAADALRPTTGELLKHLSLLFVPAGVGVMLHLQRFATEGVAIVVAIVASTVLTLVVTAVTVERVARRLGQSQGGEGGEGSGGSGGSA
jgi:holin-like protein